MVGLLAAARRLAAGRPEAGDVDTVHGAVAYFASSVTRHFLDEEGSVFPRLSTRRPDLTAQLAALSAEHPPQIDLQHRVAETAKQLDGDARPTAGKRLLELAEQLDARHRAHVATEDEIFRAAGDALTAEDDQEIVSEMEMRRDRDGGERKSARGGGNGLGTGRGSRRGQHSATAKTVKPAAKTVKPAAKTATARPQRTSKPKAKARAVARKRR
jgi:hemerythrin-like domain-containing protein